MARYVFTLSLPDATGASRMVCHFAAAFRRGGHEVALVHGPLPSGQQSIVPEMQSLGVETICEAELALSSAPWRRGRLSKTIRSLNPTAVIGVQQRDRAHALKAAHRIGVPGFISAQNNHHFWGPRPLRALKEYAYARTLRRYARLVICSSPSVQEEVATRYGLGQQRTRLLPNAIDLSKFTPITAEEREALRAGLGVRPDELMLVNVGRMNVQKGQDILLEAFRQLSDRRAKLVLVGGISESAIYEQMRQYRDRLVQFVEEHGLQDRVIFAGWRNDVPKILKAADAYVHSARWEGFGIASFEGMAAGLPTIWTDCWGRPDGFGDGVHGWLVSTENAAALRDAMEQVLSLSGKERAQVGSASRDFVAANYDSTRIGDRFVSLIESSLAC